MSDLGDLIKLQKIMERPNPWPGWTREEIQVWEKRRWRATAPAAYVLVIGLARRRLIPLEPWIFWDRAKRRYTYQRHFVMALQASLWGTPRKVEVLEPIPRLRAMLTAAEWDEMRTVPDRFRYPPTALAPWSDPYSPASPGPEPSFVEAMRDRFELERFLTAFSFMRAKQLRRSTAGLPPPSPSVIDDLAAI